MDCILLCVPIEFPIPFLLNITSEHSLTKLISSIKIDLKKTFFMIFSNFRSIEFSFCSRKLKGISRLRRKMSNLFLLNFDFPSLEWKWRHFNNQFVFDGIFILPCFSIDFEQSSIIPWYSGNFGKFMKLFGFTAIWLSDFNDTFIWNFTVENR